MYFQNDALPALNSVILFHNYGIVYQGFGPAHFSFPITPRLGKHNSLSFNPIGHWVDPRAKGDLSAPDVREQKTGKALRALNNICAN